MLGEEIQKLLGTPHREGRNHHVAAVPVRGRENGSELRDGVLARLVQAIAVGRFHDHQVGRGHRRGIAQDRRAVGTEVAAENEPARRAAFVGVDCHGRRTEDVPGVAQRELHAGKDLRGCVVRHRPHQPDCLVHVILRVQRHGRLLPGPRMAVVLLGVHRGDVRGIGQHDRRKVDGGGMREDGSGKTTLHQQRHPPGMVDVRMAQHQRIERSGIERKCRRVAFVGPAPVLLALHHSAIQQHAPACGFDEMARAGHLARRAVKHDVHRDSPPSAVGAVCRDEGHAQGPRADDGT